MLWLSTIRRLVTVLFIITRHLTAFGFGVAFRRPGRLSGPERLRLALEQMGGTYIKFGQMLALQPDILPLNYCNALFNLLDRVAPFGVDQVVRTFIEETGRSPFDIFDTFDARPLATASIGQVHVATLDGRKLAVKVQRPKVDEDFGGDIRFMTTVVAAIRGLRFRPLFWMIEPMSEFVEWTREELDYRFEARYMEQLRRNCRNNPRERVPQVVWEYTTRRTLTIEFFEGLTLLACIRALEAGDSVTIDRLDRQGFDSHAVASNIIDNFLGDVFEHGMFHADLHPANLMVLRDNVVGYIDFGITGVISLYSRRNLIGLTLAYTRGDLDGMCNSFFKVSSIGPESDIAGFRRGLAEAGLSWYTYEGGVRRLRKNFTLVMLDMLRLSRKTGIWPERDVIKYIRSAIAIDGLITRFAPTFDLARYLESACEGHLKWQIRRNLLTLHNLAGCALSSANLMRDGGSRATQLLAFMAEASGPPVRPETQAGGQRRDSGVRTMFAAGCFFALCLTVSVLKGRPDFGLNLFTAEMLVAAGAFIALMASLRSSSRNG